MTTSGSAFETLKATAGNTVTGRRAPAPTTAALSPGLLRGIIFRSWGRPFLRVHPLAGVASHFALLRNDVCFLPRVGLLLACFCHAFMNTLSLSRWCADT